MSDEEKDPFEGRESIGDQDFQPNELQIHDPYVIPSQMELDNEIDRPKWWYAQQLRLAGASWPEIARALGYKDGLYARKIVNANITDWKVEAAQDLVRMELERLDMLQLVVWRRARQGSLKDIEAVLKIMQMRAKYLGLEDMSTTDEEASNGVIVIGGNSEEYIEAIKKAGGKVHQPPVEGEVAS